MLDRIVYVRLLSNINKRTFDSLQVRNYDNSINRFNQKKLKTTNMLRIQLHIEAMNCFSPKWDYGNSGACYAAS